ncbi:hypothetical protein ACP275_04G132800 [Erythranthe tilingii]
MAAAYAALVSLTHTIDQILYPPPTLCIIVDRSQIESLRQKADFLIDFLENNSSNGGEKEVEDLMTRIMVAADGAEYNIEFNVMKHIVAVSEVKKEYTIFNLCAIGKFRLSVMKKKNHAVDRVETSNLLYEGIRTAIEEFHSIEKEVVKMKKHVQRPKYSKLTEASSSSRPLPRGKNTMVGLDDHVNEIMGSLSSVDKPLRIHTIVGMGGIGKTTLATNVFNNLFIVEKFKIRAWFVVSQECTQKEILLGLLHQINTIKRNELEMNDDDDDELGEKLHKTLFGRKYLIVMDDMWDIKAWDMVKRFLPDNSNGSRILVTTRLLKLAAYIGSCTPYKLNLLDEEQSWDLLREKVFAHDCFPIELEGIGKRIAKKCRGLPLALVAIAGNLAMSKTEEHWKYVEEDVTSAVNNQDDEFCMKILSLSYNHLPIHLKPCFLYFAVFPEDYVIQVSRLIRLWVAEGFIRQCGHKSLEEIGEEYLDDLIDRNLILVCMRSITGEVSTCRIHDLLLDLCRREAQEDNFILTGKLYNMNILTNTKTTRRLSINGGKWNRTKRTPDTSPVPTRSFLCFSYEDSTDYTARRFPLLRILDVVDRYPKDEILQLINSRYGAFKGQMSMSSSTLSRLWSLQTLVVDGELILPSEIWQMPQLRHVVGYDIILPDPPPPDDVHKITLLENLQTLSTVENFKCTEAVINRIPNVKKLVIVCGTIGSNNCLRNIGLLHKLKELYLECPPCGGDIAFPSSLKQLRLRGCKIPWEDMSIVGSLPNLEELQLHGNAAVGQKWISKDGEFVRLKFLWIHACQLEIWESEDTHFPYLEFLKLGYLNLKEIPSEFAQVVPLRVISLDYNISNDLFESAKEISEQRENLGYDFLQVRNFTFGMLSIWVKSGINLAGGGGGNRDPYVVITTLDNKSVETRVVMNDVNPEWDEKLILEVADPNHPFSLVVYDHNKFSMNNQIGVAEFDIKLLVKAAGWMMMHWNSLPNGTIFSRILPATSNCLSKESCVLWDNGRVIQDMCLRLQNVECGEIELQLEWINL